MNSNRKIILASQSKSRKSVLEQLGLSFMVHESHYEEDMTLNKTPEELAKFLSLGKAKNVATSYTNAIIIAGDTFIVYKNKIIGKPKNEKDAIQMLQNFSGKSIKVVSGLAIIDTKNNKIVNDYGVGFVNFRKLNKKEIKMYAKTKESLRSAGAFAVAGLGAILIDSIKGDLYAINTIPLVKLYLGLQKLGINLLKNKR